LSKEGHTLFIGFGDLRLQMGFGFVCLTKVGQKAWSQRTSVCGKDGWDNRRKEL